MQLGESVNGLMMTRHTRFIVSDAHNVAEQVRAYDERARLVAHDQTHRVSVARFIERAELGKDDIDALVGAPVTDRGGAYMLVFHPKRRDGTDMIGEPDSSVIEQLRQRDVHSRRLGVNEREILTEMEKINAIREARAAEILEEKRRANTEERMFDFSREWDMPWKPGRIIVPRGIPDGRG